MVRVLQNGLIAVIHTSMLFFQVVTLNVAVNSYSNALLSLLMSNQFVEIKGTVFKKFEKENLFQMSCAGIFLAETISDNRHHRTLPFISPVNINSPSESHRAYKFIDYTLKSSMDGSLYAIHHGFGKRTPCRLV
jgi:hypothetical protein